MPIAAALRAFGVVAKEAWRHGDLAGAGSGEPPRQIVADAMNCDIPAADVLARAIARSRTGRLVEVVRQKIAERQCSALGGLI